MGNESSVLDIKERGDVMIARFVQARILDAEIMRLALAQIMDVMERSTQRKLYLNFASVEYLSSGALGTLITLHKKLSALGGRFGVINVIPQIFELFAITKLDKFLKLDENGEDLDDPEADLGGVPSRLIPPKPSNSGAVKLPLPRPEQE